MIAALYASRREPGTPDFRAILKTRPGDLAAVRVGAHAGQRDLRPRRHIAVVAGLGRGELEAAHVEPPEYEFEGLSVADNA